MFGYFFNFHNHPFGDDLFFEYSEEGTPPPPPVIISLIDERNGNYLINERNGNFLSDERGD